MPSKCPFCCQKYSRSGAYEKHLRTVHVSLDIVLASTVQYNNIQTGELLNTDASEHQNSDYESDLGPAGLEPDAFCPDIAYEADAEVFDPTSACAGKQNHFEGAGEVIGDVAGFEDEHSNLCRTHGHHSIARKVSNWHPGSLTEKYPKPESTITSRVA